MKIRRLDYCQNIWNVVEFAIGYKLCDISVEYLLVYIYGIICVFKLSFEFRKNFFNSFEDF